MPLKSRFNNRLETFHSYEHDGILGNDGHAHYNDVFIPNGTGIRIQKLNGGFGCMR